MAAAKGRGPSDIVNSGRIPTNGITLIHIAGGMLALAAGSVDAAVPNGSGMHASVATWFCVSMFVLAKFTGAQMPGERAYSLEWARM